MGPAPRRVTRPAGAPRPGIRVLSRGTTRGPVSGPGPAGQVLLQQPAAVGRERGALPESWAHPLHSTRRDGRRQKAAGVPQGSISVAMTRGSRVARGKERLDGPALGCWLGTPHEVRSGLHGRGERHPHCPRPAPGKGPAPGEAAVSVTPHAGCGPRGLRAPGRAQATRPRGPRLRCAGSGVSGGGGPKVPVSRGAPCRGAR